MTILKRKDEDGNKYGSYRISVYKGKDAGGKKHWHWETFDGNIQQAREREIQVKYALKHGTYAPPNKVTLSEYMDIWLRDYVKPNLKPSVYRGYEQIIRCHLKPCLGKVILTNLTGPQIKAYYSDRLKCVKAQTVQHHHTLLHKALKDAIADGYIIHNPSDGITPPKVKRPEIQTYGPDEVGVYLIICKTDEPEYYPLFVISLHCGIRRSELCGLKWGDVDDLFLNISINRGLHVGKGHDIQFTEPKTDKSRRLIPLTPTSSLVLKEHFEYCKPIYQKLGKELTDNDFIFQHLDTGEPLLPGSVSHAWARIRQKAKLKHVTLHGARHTMASIMLKQGIHPKIVQERLGHANIATTLDLYSHLIPTIQEDAAKQLDAAFKLGYNTKDAEKS